MSTSAELALSEGWGLRGSLEPLGDGHINDTYLVECGEDRYVLQRLNPAVFADGALVLAQQRQVVTHLRSKVPVLVPAMVFAGGDGDGWQAEDSAFWKLTAYVPGHTVTNPSPESCRAAGWAFGRFRRQLEDLPGPPLQKPIPGFLDLGHYLEAWLAVEQEEWRRFVDERRTLQTCLSDAPGLVHGDCKVTNVRFTEPGNNQGQTVAALIDLDTVMPGPWAWDLGDLVRSAACDGVTLNLDRFAATLHGYQAGLGDRLAEDDVVLGPRYMAFMLGLRFLTDHLTGDRYFKVHARGDNLERARDQFRLLESMEQAEAAMRSIARAVSGAFTPEDTRY